MTSKPFEPSASDPSIRPDTDNDGTPLVAPGVDPQTPGPIETTPAEPEPERQPEKNPAGPEEPNPPRE